MEEFETPNNGETSTNTTRVLQNPNDGETITAYEHTTFYEDFDSACSTPYVSAPSSPGRGPQLGGFFYSAPASPVHFVLSKSNLTSLSTTTPEAAAPPSSVEFEFSARYTTNGSTPTGSMSSADELFLNGKIRPMKLSSHLLRPQALSPLLDLDEINGGDSDGSIDEQRGRDLKFSNRSLRRRTRSMSPLRNTSFQWHEEENENESNQNMEIKQNEAAEAASETTPSGSSSRSSSVGRSSKRWVFLKEFLYRSKSEGRNNGNHKFWSSLSFSPVGKDKKISTPPMKEKSMESKVKQGGGEAASKKVRRSAHELHYTANRAQSEEMRKKTFLPYRQGLLGCLGFSSKSYGAMNGFARALNPVSSR